MAGRPKKYSAKQLSAAVEKYFAGISYMAVARNGDGEAVVNLLGEEAKVLCWVQPPTLGGLCLHLGIDRSTWAEYANPEKNPKHARVCAAAKSRIEQYLHQELITRERGSLRGLEFDLAVNYGWSAKQSLEIAGTEGLKVNISVVDEVKKNSEEVAAEK